MVHYICKIDRDVYSCICGALATDEVIITDKQIEHSNEHNGAYEKYCESVKRVIGNPKYIFEDSMPQTGLVVGELDSDYGKSLMVVLRIKTSTDPENYKNSIISCWDISEKRLNRYIKNRKLLYKRA